jgi:hypothetical protein
MLNLTKTVAHLNIPSDSPSRAIQAVRGRLERANSEKIGATDFVKALLDIDVTFETQDQARIAAFALIEDVITHKCEIDDAELAFDRAVVRANTFLGKSENSWMFNKPKESGVEQVAVVDGIDMKVGVKEDGKLARGGKKMLAEEIYKREAAKNGGVVDSVALAAIYVKDLGMTKLGARTYVYNMRKALGVIPT